jgi:hypothetical protein
MSAQQNGRDFENKIHKLLLKTKLPVLREMDIKHKFGQNISGIDHMIEFSNICLCFQDKHQKTSISNAQVGCEFASKIAPSVRHLSQTNSVGHFITCVNNVSDILQKKCIGIFISIIDFSNIAIQQIELENNKQKNEFNIIYDNNYVYLMKKILFYFYSNGIWMYDGEDCMMIY